MAQGTPQYGMPDDTEVFEWLKGTYALVYHDDPEELAKLEPMAKAVRKRLKVEDCGGLRACPSARLGGALATVLEASEVDGMTRAWYKWLGPARGTPHVPPGTHRL